jgi:hypothetical protein
LSVGYLYLITNAAWPGYCKIGKTENRPGTRLLNAQTWTPHRDYELVHWRCFPNVHLAEKEIHIALKGHRTRGNGEWFRLHPTDAVQWINALCGSSKGQVRHRGADGAG